MRTKISLLPILMVCLLSVMMNSCIPSYKFNGSALNYDVYKTINVGEFPIRAALVYPPLQQTFENKLLDAITRQTRLNEIDTNNADLEMTGEITGLTSAPLCFPARKKTFPAPRQKSCSSGTLPSFSSAPLRPSPVKNHVMTNCATRQGVQTTP